MTRAPRPDRELEEVLRIGREAAQIVNEVYATAFVVEMKTPGDPVTRADREANDRICEELAKSFPGDAVIAEESAPTDRETLASMLTNERVFFVDPLDGTREFAARREGEFAVMIGLAIAGRPTVGVIILPSSNEALAARVGGACFLEDERGARTPLAVSDVSETSAATIVVSRSRPPRILAAARTHLGVVRELVCGSVGAKAAHVARGTADIYVHGGGGAQRWDTCAPEAVLVAAGGRFTDLDGEKIDYRSADLTIRTGIVASNARLHAQVLAVTRAERSR